MRGRFTALLVVALVAGAALPAVAGDRSASLRSVGPADQSVFEVGDEISIPYDVHGAGDLQGVSLEYVDAYGGYTYISTWADEEEPLAPELVDTVTTDWKPGSYELQTVGLFFSDYEDDTYFTRDGSTYNWNDDSQGSHDVDLSAADFSVVNDEADVTAPVLESFDVGGDGVRHYDDELNVTYEASDASGIDYAFFVFRDSKGREHWAYDSTTWDEETGDDIPPDGIAGGTIDVAWASGPSELVMVGIVDGSGNYGNASYYEPGGVTTTEPPGLDDPPSDGLDFAAGTIEVDNAEFDITAPELSSITRVSPDHIYPGEDLEIAYLADDPHFESIDVYYEGPEDGPGLWGDSYDAPAAGQLIAPVWDFYEPGSYALQFAGVHDSGVGDAWFDRDGTVQTYDENDEPVYATHSLDFPALDFTLDAWPYEFEDAGVFGDEIFLAPEAGKVRADLGGMPFVQDEVEFTLTGDESWAVRYADTDFSIVGTFDGATGDFFTVVRRGNRAEVLTNDPRSTASTF